MGGYGTAGAAAALFEVCAGTTPIELIETYVAGLLELPGWLAAMGGQLEDLEDSSIRPLSSYTSRM